MISQRTRFGRPLWREHLKGLRQAVRLFYFTQKHACGGCAKQRALLEKLTVLSDKLKLEVCELGE